MLEPKPNQINPEDLCGDELFYTARDMSRELKEWLVKYELCFGHKEILRTIKKLQSKLERELDYEEARL